MTISNPVNNNGTPDYSKTIREPNFSPPVGTKNCNDNFTNSPCINESDKKKEAIKDIVNSTVYFLGDTVVNNANNTDFKESVLIFNGNLDAQNFIGIQNVSIFATGNSTIDQLEANNLTVYSSGSLDFIKHVYISNSRLRSIGRVNIQNQSGQAMKISNTHILMEGKGNYIQSLRATDNSTLCIKNDTEIKNLEIDESSSVYILETVTKMNYTLINSNKMPLKISQDVFEEKCYGTRNSDDIDVLVESKTNITPETILSEVDYNVTD